MTEIGRYIAEKMQLKADAAEAKGRAEGIAEAIAKGIAKGITKGIADGIAKGIAEGIAKVVKNMYNNKLTFDIIAKCLDITELEVINILKNNQVITMLPTESDLRSL